MHIQSFYRIPLFMGLALILSAGCTKDDNNNLIVKDIDGNIYHTITLGSQVWMVENLKTTRYRNGDPIPHITDSTEWSALTYGAYCNYGNLSSLGTIFGKLYNYYAVEDNRNIAPIGWHVPSEEEWLTLINYLVYAGYNYDGTPYGSKIGKSMASDRSWTYSSNEGSVGNSDYSALRNISGFTAIAAGHRTSKEGIWKGIGLTTGWWSTTEFHLFGYPQIVLLELDYDSSKSIKTVSFKTGGLSIRCVKD